MPRPFLSFYTPTYRRPVQLARCMESVQRQTAVADVEHIIVPDYIGVGIGGMFGRIREQEHYNLPRGEYVYFLADDDVLASTGAVAALADLVDRHRDEYRNGPHVVIVGSQKPGGYYPPTNEGPPVEGSIDLGCLVVRRDVWRSVAAMGGYGERYEGDYDFASALWSTRWLDDKGHEDVARWVWLRELHFCTGAASHGKAEGQWAVTR